MAGVATWGGVNIVTSTISRGGIRRQKLTQWGFNAFMTAVFPPWMVIDAAQAYYDTEISSLPGLTEGDRTLTLQLSVEVQQHQLTAGYSSMYRDGKSIHLWGFHAVWSPTLPPK